MGRHSAPGGPDDGDRLDRGISGTGGTGSTGNTGGTDGGSRAPLGGTDPFDAFEPLDPFGPDGLDLPAPPAPGTPGYISGTLPSGPPGTGRRRRGPAEESDYFVPVRPTGPHVPGQRPGGTFDRLGDRLGDRIGDRLGHAQHPEHPEHAAWGRSGTWPAAAAGHRDRAAELVEEWAADWAAHDTASGSGGADRPPVAGRPVPRLRQEFVDAFDVPPPPRPARPAAEPAPEPEPAVGAEPPAKRGRGRALSGIAAAAVMTTLAVVVGMHVHRSDHRHTGGDGRPGGGTRPAAGEDPAAAPSASATATATAAPDYDALMSRQYPLDPGLSLSGDFTTVPGHQAAPGRGKVVRFRVDVEKGLPLDAGLFSDAVFKTLNDPRSWGHGGTMTFERVSTGPADIVVTLASPGTTDKWCAKSGLDTRVDNVSCDSASTPRTMINAYRWARGAATYGSGRMLEYRQMLVNHEVGHRLGHGHVGCPKEGAPAPVMMQQTKFLSLDGGPTCTPNPWPFP